MVEQQMKRSLQNDRRDCVRSSRGERVRKEEGADQPDIEVMPEFSRSF